MGKPCLGIDPSNVNDGRITYIITYFRKGHALLASCLKSILSNLEEGDRVVVVDDCSKDGLASFLSSHFPLVGCITLTQNLGPGLARNEGLKVLCTEYVQFVDADDLIHPDRSRILRGALEANSEISFVSSQIVTFEGDIEFQPIEKGTFQITPSHEVPYLPAVGLFRSKFLNEVGTFDHSRRWMDLSFHAAIISRSLTHLHCELPLYAYRQGEVEQISSIAIDTEGSALRSFMLAKQIVQEEIKKPWLYPLSTTLARQSAGLPMGYHKAIAMIQPIKLAPTNWVSFKWIVFLLLNFFRVHKK